MNNDLVQFIIDTIIEDIHNSGQVAQALNKGNKNDS